MRKTILSFSKLIKNLDMFGKTFSFEEQGNKLFTTIIGGVLTIFLYLATITLGFLFGLELYYKENPLVISSNEIANITESGVDMKNFPFIINFVDKSGIVIENIDKIIKVDALHYYVNEKMTADIVPLEFGYCDPSYFDIENRQFAEDAIKQMTYKNKTSSSLCIKPKGSLPIQGKFSTQFSKFILMTFSLCNQNTSSCAPNMEQYLEFNFYIAMRYLNTYIDHKNYTNPIVKYMDTTTINIGAGIGKRSQFKFINN